VNGGTFAGARLRAPGTTLVAEPIIRFLSTLTVAYWVFLFEPGSIVRAPKASSLCLYGCTRTLFVVFFTWYGELVHGTGGDRNCVDDYGLQNERFCTLDGLSLGGGKDGTFYSAVCGGMVTRSL